MYSIGEFARISQVSTRLLRYYNEIGLLQPSKVDGESGYRYYSAEQLPRLNRILALKELGLSLDQIRRLVKHDISLDELKGMLLIKKAELEKHVLDELKRIRTIESRLKQIQERGKNVRDVVIKEIPQQQFSSIHSAAKSWDEALIFFASLQRMIPGLDRTIYSLPIIVLHADGSSTDLIEFEIGVALNKASKMSLFTPNGTAFGTRSLEAATMATFVLNGPSYEAHIGFSAIGEWAEANNYRFAGPMREVVLRPPQKQDMSDLIVELQFPVQKNSVDLSGTVP